MLCFSPVAGILLIETQASDQTIESSIQCFSPVADSVNWNTWHPPELFAARFSPVAGILLIETPLKCWLGKTFVSDFGRCLRNPILDPEIFCLLSSKLKSIEFSRFWVVWQNPQGFDHASICQICLCTNQYDCLILSRLFRTIGNRSFHSTRVRTYILTESLSWLDEFFNLL